MLNTPSKKRFPKTLLAILDADGNPHIIASMTDLTDDKVLSDDQRVARYGFLGVEPEPLDTERPSGD